MNPRQVLRTIVIARRLFPTWRVTGKGGSYQFLATKLGQPEISHDTLI